MEDTSLTLATWVDGITVLTLGDLTALPAEPLGAGTQVARDTGTIGTWGVTGHCNRIISTH